MSDIVRQYETIFIIKPTLDEEGTNAVIEKFKSLIEENGKVEQVDIWGRRKLAYEINDFREGYYVLVNFSSNTNFITELERIYKISDNIIRYIVINKES